MSIILPVPTLFDFQSKERYYVYETESREHNAEVEAARLAEEEAHRASTSYHFNYYPDQRW